MVGKGLITHPNWSIVSCLRSLYRLYSFGVYFLQEKWDSMTRKWRDHKSLVQLVRLFLIDEVHQLNDESRGPTMEAIVSRMKTIRASISWEDEEKGGGGSMDVLRFIAISATIPNITDVRESPVFGTIEREQVIIPLQFYSQLGCLLAWIGRTTSIGIHVSFKFTKMKTPPSSPIFPTPYALFHLPCPLPLTHTHTHTLTHTHTHTLTHTHTHTLTHTHTSSLILLPSSSRSIKNNPPTCSLSSHSLCFL